MASYDDVLKALQAADAAGNAQDAQQLAMIADQMRSSQQSTTLGQKALGVGETALSAGTGILGQLAGNVAGVGRELLTGDFGKGTAEKTAQQVQQALTYQPRGEVAPQILQGLQTAVETSKIAPTPITGAANIGFRTKAKVPSSADIKQQASNLYQTIDDAGVLIKSEPFGQLVNKIKVDIGGKIRQIRQPNVVDAINQLDEATGSAMTLRKLQDLRSSISEIKMSKNMSESKFAGDIIKELDDFVDNLDASKLISPAKGDLEAIKLVPEARNLWKQARKSELLDEIYEKAGFKPNAKYDDVVFATKLRDEFRNLATNKNKLRGFSAEEVKAIKDAAQGGRIENALRAFGRAGQGERYSPEGGLVGGGLSSFAFGPEFGNLVAGPIGAYIGLKTVPAIKGVSRMAAGQLGKQNLQNVMDLVKTSGNPYSGIKLFQGNTAPLNAAGLLAPYITNPDDLKSLLGQ